MFSGFSKTVTGESHIKSGKVCQDCSEFVSADRYGIAVAADGHGSSRHFRSHIGSRLAVDVTLNTIREFYRSAEEFEESFTRSPEKIIRKIQKHIISHWNMEIADYHEKNPVTEDEVKLLTQKQLQGLKTEAIYGTTLIAVVMTEKFSFGIQLGDGNTVIVNENAQAHQPIIDDESHPANLTASMCNSNAIEMFGYFYTFDKLLAAFVSTDGLYTSFETNEDFLDYHTIITGLLDDDMLNFNQIISKNITMRSSHGTQDDISVAGVFREGNIQSSLNIIMEQIKLNKTHSEIRKAEKKARLNKQKIKLARMSERREEENDNTI